MHKILAISGGIDSVVMLHRFRNDEQAIVAHFDHGIRSNSRQDHDFVQALAVKYGMPFISRHDNLGPNCSEALARERRYDFLQSVAQKYQGKIYTAHHQDDLVESIIINLLRGTGWRGLVPLDNPNICRPLIGKTKKDIFCYAAKHQLNFRQDPSNTSDLYLRNRIRAYLTATPIDVNSLLASYVRQKELKVEIDQILELIASDGRVYQRKFYKDLDDAAALEILRKILSYAGVSTTRPQRQDFLAAIRHYANGKSFNLPKGRLVQMQKNTFVIK